MQPMTELPTAIEGYFAAEHAGDREALIATFAAGGTIADEGATYVGRDEIRRWREGVAAKYTYTITVTGSEELGGGRFRVGAHIAGDFPGGEADVDFEFELAADGLIDRLAIG